LANSGTFLGALCFLVAARIDQKGTSPSTDDEGATVS
jgi:hypothetical protein